MGALLLAFDEMRVMAMPAGSGPVDAGAGRVPDRGIAYWLSGALAAAASALLTYLAALVPVFAGLAVISLAAAWLLLRRLAPAGRGRRWDRRHLPFGRKFPIVRTEGGFTSDRSA